jgi:hypothetical protein
MKTSIQFVIGTIAILITSQAMGAVFEPYATCTAVYPQTPEGYKLTLKIDLYSSYDPCVKGKQSAEVLMKVDEEQDGVYHCQHRTHPYDDVVTGKHVIASSGKQLFTAEVGPIDGMPKMSFLKLFLGADGKTSVKYVVDMDEQTNKLTYLTTHDVSCVSKKREYHCQE